MGCKNANESSKQIMNDHERSQHVPGPVDEIAGRIRLDDEQLQVACA